MTLTLTLTSQLFYWFWAFARAVSEIQDIDDWSKRGLRRYWNNAWNRMDVICFATTIVIMGLRVCGKDDVEPANNSFNGSSDVRALQVARVLYSLLSIPVFVRIVQFLRFFKSVGVLTIVLSEMLRDVILFTGIMIIMVTTFAVSFGTVLHDPQERQEWYRKPLGLAPFWATFWAVFGWNGKAEIETYSRSEPDLMQRVAPFLAWAFLFLNLIMVRLLVAMLASTYNRIIKESEGFWLFERAALIAEYKDGKPPLPPPLNFFWYLYLLASFIRRRWGMQKQLPLSRGFKRIPDSQRLQMYHKQEEQAHRRCMKARQARQGATMVARSERQEKEIKKLEEQNRARFEALNGRIDQLLGYIENKEVTYSRSRPDVEKY